MRPLTRDPLTFAGQAVRRVVQEHDRDALAALIEAEWVHLVRVPGLVVDLLARLDHDHFDRHPALELILDQVRPAPAAPVSTLETITEVERLIESGHFDDDAARAGVEHIVLLALFDHGRYERARPHVAAIRASLDRLAGRVGVDARKLGALALHSGRVHLLSGHLAEAAEELLTANRLPDVHPGDLADAAGELALVHALQGEPAIAECWAAHADRLSDGLPADRREPVLRHAQLCARLLLAVDRLDWVRYEEVLSPLHTGRFRGDGHRPLVTYAQARAALVRGQQRQALDQLAHLRRTASLHVPPGSLAHTLIAGIETQLALSLGDHHRAGAAMPDKITDHHQVLRRSRWLLANGRTTEAADLIAKGAWIDRAPRRGLIELSLTRATALHRGGDHDEAAWLVLRALTQAGDPQTIGHALATTDQGTLAAAAEREPAVKAALERLRIVLFVPPAPDLEPRRGASLTRREQLILGQLADGGTAAEIAAGLYVSVHTVRNQIQRIYRKLHATSRQHAIDIATSRGLLSTPHSDRDATAS